jgi:uncharacterized protein YdeI (BOF family)
MTKFLLRLSLAAAVTLAAAAITPRSSAQSDPDPAPSSQQPTSQQPTSTPQEPAATAPQQDSQMSNDMQTQEAKAFSGRIVKENGELVLKDPVAKVSYKLDDQSKAKRYSGKQVKVTGKLDMDSNTIHVDSIKLLS